ncbi:tigger transposable element derived 5 [Anaeramoeba flamelloides]|uniref:Tigger transposable element derived 5 n=1 Tax=Anaeramoeba flamelloides TaxID=1746091 RepID=A0ABQ8YV14_9EUKA|nr:tigger transposable element derived 5 [Anaeramoeba flamelloides]
MMKLLQRTPQPKGIVDNERSSEVESSVTGNDGSKNGESGLVHQEVEEMGEIEEVVINSNDQERSIQPNKFTVNQIEELLEIRVHGYLHDQVLSERQTKHKNDLVKLFRQFPELMTIKNPIEMFGSALCVCERRGIKALNVSFIREFFGISRGKIPRAKKAIALGRVVGHNGRPYILNVSEEEYVVQRLKILSLIGWAPTLDETIDIANEIVMSWFNIDPNIKRPLIVSKNWVRKFAKRNKLKITKSTPIEYKRIMVNEEIVKDFFITLKGLCEEKEYKSKLIFKMDETSLQISKSSTYSVISPEVKKKSYRAKLPTKRHLSAVCTISAWGNCLKTLYLLPQKSLNKSVFEKTNLSNYAYATSPRGFITKDLFYEWVRCVFIPEVEAIREFNKLPKDEWALLVLDGHNSRANLAAIHLLQQHYVDCIVIPSHSSHLLQPLDVGIFKYFKTELRRQQSKKKRKNFFLLVDHCLNYATSTMHCVDAFADAGIYPLKLLKINNDIPIFPAEVKEFSFSNFNYGSRIKMSGQVITSSKFIEHMINQEKRKKEAKKKSSKKHKPPSHLFKQLFFKIKKPFFHQEFNYDDNHNIINISRTSTIEQINKRLLNDENTRRFAQEKQNKKKQMNLF